LNNKYVVEIRALAKLREPFLFRVVFQNKLLQNSLLIWDGLPMTAEAEMASQRRMRDIPIWRDKQPSVDRTERCQKSIDSDACDL
jgi:hypothetical protein